MKRFWIVGAMALLAASGTARVEAAGKVQWRSSLSSALAEAKRTGKPVLLDLSAGWCAPCHMMDQNTWTNAKIVNETRRWIPVKVDIDAAPAVGRQYGAPPLPKIVYLHPNGRVAGSIKGFQSPGTMLQSLRSSYSNSR